MAENSVAEKEKNLDKKITRRVALGGAVATGVAVGAAIVKQETGVLSQIATVAGKALGEFFNRPTEEQIKAAEALERGGLVKVAYEVLDHPDIRKVHGLAVRKDPHIPTKPNAGTTISTLQPGQTIEGIEWEGGNIKFPERQGRYKDWIAFKASTGRVGFVANNSDYLKRVSPPANPLP